MTEKQLVIEGISLGYEGYFDTNALYNFIDRYTRERGWDKQDVLHDIKNKESYRDIYLDLRPSKTISDYAKFMMKIIVNMTHVTDEIIELDGKKIKTNKGKVNITLNGFMMTDYEGDWQSSAKWTFMKTIYDKFIFRSHTEDFENMLKDEVHRLRNEISAFLNIKKHVDSQANRTYDSP